MSTDVFYVKNTAGQYVQAKYLQVDGGYVLDPNASKAINTAIYADSQGQNSLQNTNGYLIVPADYSVANAIQDGQTIYSISNYSQYAGLLYMANQFVHYGSNDLQRTYDGQTNAPFVSAFTDAASYNLGIVAYAANIPLVQTLSYGGLYNFYFGGSDAGGLFSNTKANALSIVSGYVAAYNADPSSILNQSAIPQLINNPDGGITLNFYTPGSNTILAAQYILNANNTSQANYYYPSQVTDSIIVKQFLNPDGSGSVVANGQLLTFTSGFTPNFAADSLGNVDVTLTPTSGSGAAVTYGLTNGGFTTHVGGQQVVFGLTGQAASIDANGTLTIGSALGDIVIPAGSGTAHVTLSNGTNLTVSDPSSIADDGAGTLKIAVNDPAASGTADLLYNGSTGDVGFELIGSNGVATSVDLGTLSAGDTISATGSSFTINSSAGAELQSLQTTADGGFATSSITANGTVQRQYNEFGQLTHSTARDASGNYANTTYSTDPNSSWYSQSVAHNSNGDVIGTSIVNRDGSETLQSIDPATGESVIIQVDDNHKIASVSGSNNSHDLPYSAYVQAIADTLASQLISNVLIKNDLPASAAATAFTDAVIANAVNGGDFNTQLATSVFSVAGSIAGSEAGVALAKALGLPKEIGSLAGGVSGSLLGQYLAKEVVNDVAPNTVQGANPLSSTNFEMGLAAAGGAYVGSQLANLITSTNLGGQVTGAIASAVAVTAEATDAVFAVWAAANPALAVLEVFSVALGSDFIGTLIGDIFGGLFGDGYRGPPFANAGIGLSNGQFSILSTGTDNNGDVQEAITLANDADQILNSVLASIGGQATSSTYWGIGYHGSNFHSEPVSQLPNENDYADPSAAITEAVIGVLKSTTIVGGNMYMKYVLATTNQTDLTALSNDLNVARDYSLFAADPNAFYLALALGTEQQYQTWQAEYARAMELGLNNLAQFNSLTGNITFGHGGGQTLTVAANDGLILLDGSQDNNVTLLDGSAALMNTSNDVITLDGPGTSLVVGGGSHETINVNGLGDKVTVNDLNTLIVLNGDSEKATLNYAYSTLVINGAHGSATVSGDSGTQYINGTQADVTIDGASNWTHIAGTNANVVLNGSLNNLTVDGNDNTVSVNSDGSADYINGSDVGLTVNSAHGLAVLGGENDTAIINGAYDNLTVNGNDSGATVNGDSSNQYINGTDVGLTVNGRYSWATLSGTVEAAFINGDYDNLTINGNYDSAVVNGNGSSDYINGNGDSLTLNGQHSWAYLTGSGIAAYLNGAYDNLTITGNNDSAAVSSDYSSDYFNGNNGSITLNGQHSWAYLNGTGTAAYLNGAYDNLTINGNYDSAAVSSNYSSDYVNGYGDSLSLGGQYGWVYVAGSGDMTYVNGSHNNLTIDGSNNGAQVNGNYTDEFVNGSGIGLTINGSYSWTNLIGSGDTVNINGAYGNITVTGSNNAINFTGAPNHASGSPIFVGGTGNLVEASNSTIHYIGYNGNITINGDNDTVHIRAGDAYSVTGSNDTVIVDTVINAHDWSTIANYDGISSLIDVTGLAYDSSITAVFVPNSGGFAAQMLVYDHGSVVDTINLQSAQNLGSLTAMPDGTGGTLLIDPPVTSGQTADVTNSFKTTGAEVAAATDTHATITQESLLLDDAFHFRDTMGNNGSVGQTFTDYSRDLVGHTSPADVLNSGPSVMELWDMMRQTVAGHDQFYYGAEAVAGHNTAGISHAASLLAQSIAGLGDGTGGYAIDHHLPTTPDYQQNQLAASLIPAHHDWVL